MGFMATDQHPQNKDIYNFDTGNIRGRVISWVSAGMVFWRLQVQVHFSQILFSLYKKKKTP